MLLLPTTISVESPKSVSERQKSELSDELSLQKWVKRVFALKRASSLIMSMPELSVAM